MEKLSYEKIKTWLTDHKMQINIAIGFIVIFILGFGAGRAEKKYHNDPKNKATQQNYTTKTTDKPTAVDTKEADTLPVQTDPKTVSSLDPATCTKIKGNVGTSGLIYHMPGGSSYKIVKAEMCFNTEEEAKAAGFRKAAR